MGGKREGRVVERTADTTVTESQQEDISAACALEDHHHLHHHHHHHLSLNREGRWGTAGEFATSFLHFPLFSTALWDLPTSGPVHSLMLSSHLFLCQPCLVPPFTVPCNMARPHEREA